MKASYKISSSVMSGFLGLACFLGLISLGGCNILSSGRFNLGSVTSQSSHGIGPEVTPTPTPPPPLVGMTFAEKLKQPGVLAGYGFDSRSNVRNFPAATAYPMKYFW